MKHKKCQAIQALLVEYSDGELTDSRGADVQDHLDDCPMCQSELDRLRRSLRLAQEVWAECQSERSNAPSSRTTTQRPRTGPRFAPHVIVSATALAIAAALFVAALFVEWQAAPSNQNRTDNPQTHVAGLSHSPRDSSAGLEAADNLDELDLDEINTLLANQSRAARLAVSAGLLATVPSLEQYSNQAEEYLSTHYSDINVKDMPIAN